MGNLDKLHIHNAEKILFEVGLIDFSKELSNMNETDEWLMGEQKNIKWNLHDEQRGIRKPKVTRTIIAYFQMKYVFGDLVDGHI